MFFVFLLFVRLSCSNALFNREPPSDAPSYEEADFFPNLHETLRECQLFYVLNEDRFCAFLDDDSMELLFSIEPINLYSAWKSHTASNWTAKEVGDWLHGFLKNESSWILVRGLNFTGGTLPSLLLPAVVQKVSAMLPENDIILLQQHAGELLLYGYQSSFCHLYATIVSTLLIILISVGVILFNYSSWLGVRRQHRSFLMLMQTKLDRLSHRVRYDLKQFGLPESRSGYSADTENDRLDGSLSLANEEAISCLEQFLKKLIVHQRELFEDSFDHLQFLFNHLDKEINAHYIWSIFFAKHYTTTFKRMSTSISNLERQVQRVSVQQCRLLEAIDILKTLNDCQQKYELSYREDPTDDIDPGSTSDTTYSSLPGAIETNEKFTSSHDAIPDCTTLETTPAHINRLDHLEGENLHMAGDENDPERAIGTSSPGEVVCSKIPKPTILRQTALTPSFYLMNPPANRLNEPVTSVFTPSHIPICAPKSMPKINSHDSDSIQSPSFHEAV